MRMYNFKEKFKEDFAVKGELIFINVERVLREDINFFCI